MHPVYQDVLARVKAGEKILDLGCCFGQDTRRLFADGAPGKNLYASDLRPEFIDLGYDLFKDKGHISAHFLTGDVFAEEGENSVSLKELDGKIDLVHASSFFHLFNWTEQVQVGIRVCRLLNQSTKDALVFGRQSGSITPGHKPGLSGTKERYRHDPASFQKMWDEIGEKTGTRWKVDASLTKRSQDPDDDTRVLYYAAHRVP